MFGEKRRITSWQTFSLRRKANSSCCKKEKKVIQYKTHTLQKLGIYIMENIGVLIDDKLEQFQAKGLGNLD